ncbi:hypothetical protein ACDQ55_00125 [Chitinophaga sp. 30R24]|uniref:hypothetical protein n=1 Tax=Chitinophaga sp. 30R24 TaxID=3248838 RepID=UPI003B916725
MQFEVNQSYIAKELCENRSKPQMHCNGRCHLRKELDRDAQQEKNNNNGKDKYEVMFVESILTFDVSHGYTNHITFSSFYKDPYLPTWVNTIFHPPQRIVS